MKEKVKFDIYFYKGLTIFGALGAAIILYFLCLRIEDLLGLFYKIFSILSPIVIGLLFAYFLNPLVAFFEKKVVIQVLNKFYKKRKKNSKIERALSIFITYFIVLSILFLAVKFVIPNLLDSLQIMITNIPIYVNNIYDYLQDFLKNNRDFASLIDALTSDITEYVTNIMVPSSNTIMTSITTGITGIVNGVINVIIGLIVSIYLIYDKESFLEGTKRVLKALLPSKGYDTVITTLNYTDKIFGGFMMAKIIDSLIIGVITFFVSTVFKIPYALIISIIVGITNIIPYFGPFLGAIPCAALLLLIDPTKCLTFIIAIFLIQQFDGNILGPKLIGNKTGIKSFWVLFSILLFGGIFGFIGMIFGVPVFAVIYSVFVTAIDKKLDKRQAQ